MDPSDLTLNELYGWPVVTGNGFDRMPAILLSETLEVKDLPFDNSSYSIGSKSVSDFVIKPGADERNGVLDAECDFLGTFPLRVLPDRREQR